MLLATSKASPTEEQAFRMTSAPMDSAASTYSVILRFTSSLIPPFCITSDKILASMMLWISASEICRRIS